MAAPLGSMHIVHIYIQLNRLLINSYLELLHQHSEVLAAAKKRVETSPCYDVQLILTLLDLSVKFVVREHFQPLVVEVVPFQVTSEKCSLNFVLFHLEYYVPKHV